MFSASVPSQPLLDVHQVTGVQFPAVEVWFLYPAAVIPDPWPPARTPCGTQKAQPHTDAPRLGLCHICLHALSQPSSLLPSQANFLEAFELPSVHTSSPPPRASLLPRQPAPATPTQTRIESGGRALCELLEHNRWLSNQKNSHLLHKFLPQRSVCFQNTFITRIKSRQDGLI